MFGKMNIKRKAQSNKAFQLTRDSVLHKQLLHLCLGADRAPQLKASVRRLRWNSMVGVNEVS